MKKKNTDVQGKTYGYCRVSTRTQSIDRQIRNVKGEYPDAVIVKEAYTGTTLKRPEWTKLYKRLKAGDVLVFDSVSRMSRDAEEGTKVYFELYEKGVQLVFLKEHYIDTTLYAESMRDKIELQGTDEDEIFKGLNNYFRRLAEKQIRIAFEQAEKEVQDLHQRTKEGIREVKRRNDELVFRYGSEEEARKDPEWKQIGTIKGKKLAVKKSAVAKKLIVKYSRDFDGALSDAETIALVGISHNTFYKYKKELKAAL